MLRDTADPPLTTWRAGGPPPYTVSILAHKTLHNNILRACTEFWVRTWHAPCNNADQNVERKVNREPKFKQEGTAMWNRKMGELTGGVVLLSVSIVWVYSAMGYVGSILA